MLAPFTADEFSLMLNGRLKSIAAIRNAALAAYEMPIECGPLRLYWLNLTG